MFRVAVDLTPVVPGGGNGGSKAVTVSLLRELAILAPGWEFVLLTGSETHEELAALDAPNVRRICLAGPAAAQAAPRRRLKEAVGAALPGRLLETAVRGYRAGLRAVGLGRMKRLQADLLFSPFMSPTFYEPNVPAVTIVYDLQFQYHPEYFGAEDLRQRRRSFEAACRCSRRIVCISDYVRGTVLECGGVAPEICVKIYLGLARREGAGESGIHQRLGVRPRRYLLYPANFWKHKNHETLIRAYRLFLDAHPASDLKLVCCGWPGERGAAISTEVAEAGLEGRVLLPGYVNDDDVTALLTECKALIFPSLYEGFGMPVLEAMQAGRPVLASNTTSLPEVGGDAFVPFDPVDAAEMSQAMTRIEEDAALEAELIARGRRRAARFGDAKAMAREYLAVLREAAQA